MANDWESINSSILLLGMNIESVRDQADFDDVLNVCQDILRLIERLNDKDAPQ